MDTLIEVFIYAGIVFFALLILWLLKEWKDQCIFGGLSKRNSKLIRAAARRQASVNRQNGNNSGANVQNRPGHVIVLPPPSFDDALNFPAPVYFIEIEEQPPNYATAVGNLPA